MTQIGRSGSAANEIGPAGETSDPDIGAVESGQPAGGPDDLGRQAGEGGRSADVEPVDPMGEGIDAHGSGRARGDCPYPADSDEAKGWREGWDRQAAIEQV